MKKILAFAVFIFSFIITPVKANTVNYISPEPPIILSQNSTLYGVQVSVYIPVFSGYDSSYMTNVVAEMRSCLGCGVTSIGISPNLAHNGLIFSGLAYDTQHTLSIRVFTQTEQLIVSKIEFRTISSTTITTTTTVSTTTTTVTTPVTTTNTLSYCPVVGFWDSKSELRIYQSLNKVTNHKLLSFDITGWNCKTNKFIALQVEDNFGITTQTSIRFDFYFASNISNCWRIKHVYENGEGEWSNKVCYTPPISLPTTVPVYTATTIPYYPPTNVPSYSYNTFVRTGAICSDGWRSTATGSGACSWHGGVYKWIGYNFLNNTLPSSSKTSSTYGSSNCVGMCFGSPSKVNGLPRNNVVSGYYRSDGTWVNPYTRSKP